MSAGSGRRSRLVTGLLTYVRPTFMLPAVGMSVYGALLAPARVFQPEIAALHAGTVGLALFVAHLRDGYIDGYRRDEETPRLDASTLQSGIRLGSAVLLVAAGVLYVAAGPLAALSVVVLLALALLHAPYLDRHPVTVTVDYPVGIGVAILGGYTAQAAGFPLAVIAVAALFSTLLSGIKIGIDRLDTAFDRSIDKRTVPVALGPTSASRVAAAVFLLAALATVAVGVGIDTVGSRFAVAAAVVPLGCLATTGLAAPERAVRIQIGLTYVFAALLFLSACGRGCAAIAPVQNVAATALGSAL
jgi:1,4-dihydroxy-2-naphthoate octaprenyltransferase